MKIDLKILIKKMTKQILLIGDKKYYIHSVFTNYATSKEGEVINVKTERKMKMCKNHAGYYRFNICYKKKRKHYFQHRFVFEAIKGVIPEGFEIDHKNEVKTDNRIINLQLLTHQQNVEKSKNKPIVSINVETNKKKIFLSSKAASIELEIVRSSISNICKKINYRKTATSKKDGNKYRFEFLE